MRFTIEWITQPIQITMYPSRYIGKQFFTRIGMRTIWAIDERGTYFCIKGMQHTIVSTNINYWLSICLSVIDIIAIGTTTFNDDIFATVAKILLVGIDYTGIHDIA